MRSRRGEEGQLFGGVFGGGVGGAVALVEMEGGDKAGFLANRPMIGRGVGALGCLASSGSGSYEVVGGGGIKGVGDPVDEEGVVNVSHEIGREWRRDEGHDEGFQVALEAEGRVAQLGRGVDEAESGSSVLFHGRKGSKDPQRARSASWWGYSGGGGVATW